MNLTVEDCVDRSAVETVNASLATRKETVKHQLEARIARVTTMVAQFEADTLSPWICSSTERREGHGRMWMFM